jgi:hypothetical protein
MPGRDQRQGDPAERRPPVGAQGGGGVLEAGVGGAQRALDADDEERHRHERLGDDHRGRGERDREPNVLSARGLPGGMPCRPSTRNSANARRRPGAARRHGHQGAQHRAGRLRAGAGRVPRPSGTPRRGSSPCARRPEPRLRRSGLPERRGWSWARARPSARPPSGQRQQQEGDGEDCRDSSGTGTQGPCASRCPRFTPARRSLNGVRSRRPRVPAAPSSERNQLDERRPPPRGWERRSARRSGTR